MGASETYLRDRRTSAVLLIATGLLLVLLYLHTPGPNGPWYWKWHWRRLEFASAAGSLLLGASPVVVGMALCWRGANSAIALTLISIAAVSLKLAVGFTLSKGVNFDFPVLIVTDAHATGYFTDAGALAAEDGVLAVYHQISPMFQVHSQSKPPGPILYHMFWIRWFGFTSEAAIAAALGQALLSALSVIATWGLGRTMGLNTSAAVTAAGLLSIFPGFALFWPMFDPFYPTLACSLIALWMIAMRPRRVFAAIGLGATLFAATLITYNVLVIGAFMVLSVGTVPASARSHSRFSERLRRAIVASVIALTSMVTFYAFLYALTGFDPIQAFSQALANQRTLLTRYAADRPYPATAIFDLTDFFLGLGWIAPIYLATAVRLLNRPLAFLTACQILCVAASSLLPGETARVWIFMMPLVAILTAESMSKRSRHLQWIILICTIIMTIAVHQNMHFLLPGGAE